MKKLIVLILFMFPVAMFAQVKVLGGLIPNGTGDTYPTHYDTLGMGGLMVTYNRTTMNAIPAARKKTGMVVRYSSSDSTFTWNGSAWVIFGTNRYQLEVASDGANGFPMPFTLKQSAIIIYGNTPLKAAQWSGTTNLTVTVATKLYDTITIINM